MAATVAIIRTLVSDPAGASQIKADADYQVIVDLESNEYRAAAVAARMLSAHFAQKVSTTVGQVKIENQQKAEAYRSLAFSYDSRAATGGGSVDATRLGTPVVTGISNSEMDSVEADTDRVASSFIKGQFDNKGCCTTCGSDCTTCGCC